jgi:hypothetical protein
MPLPEPGGLLDREFDIDGVRVGLLAEVEVSGDELHLKDVAVYPLDSSRADLGAAALLRAARRNLLPEIRQEGFRTLRVTAERLSGARPGRIVDLIITLRETS